MSYPEASGFRSAGYADLLTNSSYTGGLVRQHNKISFTRVFDAGHAVGAFQPETVSRIFDRVMFDKDVATGDELVSSNYSTSGPMDVFRVKNVLKEVEGHECYIWDAVNTCDGDEKEELMNGEAVVENFILQGNGTRAV
jgi:hypothetical protein